MTSTQENKGNTTYFVRLWRGRIPLTQTFWLYGFFGNLIFRVIILIIAISADAEIKTKGATSLTIPLYTLEIIALAYAIFSIVCVWRSSIEYRVTYPQNKLASRLAKIVCVLGGITVISGIGNILAGLDQKNQLDALVSELNKNLPKKIDDQSTLAKINIHGNELDYLWTISTDLDDKNIVNNDSKSKILPGICKDTQSLKLLSTANIKFIYYNSKGQPLGEVLMTKADCQT